MKLSWVDLPILIGLFAVIVLSSIVGFGGDSLVLRAWARPNTVEQGGLVKIYASLMNLRNEPISITFPSSLTFDFEVSGPNGYYRWSKDKFFLMVITSIELKPGESRTCEFQWKADLPPGTYIIKVIMQPMSREKLESNEVTLLISKPNGQ